MALTNEAPRNFRLFLTHVDGEGPFLKVSGQLDKQSACMVESLIETARENFEKGIGTVPPAAIHEGIVCAAKYKDGAYYRAKIISTASLRSGLVGVHFIDYGNKDIISLSTIRFLDSYDPMLLQLGGQATDYYLYKIMHITGRWEEPLLLKLQSLLCYTEYPAAVLAQTRTYPVICIQYEGSDLSQHLINNKFGIEVTLPKQEVMLLQMYNESVLPVPPNWQNFTQKANAFTEHVPFVTNQNFPMNPASAMRLQQNAAHPYSTGYVSIPSSVSQRLMVNKVSRAPISLRIPMRQPQQPMNVAPPGLTGSATYQVLPATGGPLSATPIAVSPKKSSKTYKSKLLEANSQHRVFLSYAEEGPELFAVQLCSDAKTLQDMTDEINRIPHRSLDEPPMIGTVCLGRMSGDRKIYRAIVMNLSGSQCKLFFVDFGDTEMVSYYDIFDIPEEFVKPNVFAMRFCLSGVKNLQRGPHLTEAFKKLVTSEFLTLKVVPAEGPPLIQYGELYLNNQSVLDLLMAKMNQTLQFKWMDTLARGSKHSILLSYVDSCVKFYIQLSDQIDKLNAVMDAIREHCEAATSPGELPAGAACCAMFPDDGNWYRAMVKSVANGRAVVAYVDYGNEQEVAVADLRTIPSELMQLPAQALKCALKGFEDKPVKTETSNQLEMLALEKTLMAHVLGLLAGDTMLVSLVDDSVSPPLDIARKMTQLSQPRSHEPKPAAGARKDSAESFSSPEAPEDGWRKGAARDRSSKDERKWEGDSFAQRGSSFRGKDKSFERAAPGRHSEKFAGKGERPERAGGDRRKPFESAPTADDAWEDSGRDRSGRDKRKPKPDAAVKCGPKRAEAGARRPGPDAPKPSVQDRLKRFNSRQDGGGWEDKPSNDSFSPRDRPERRDFNNRDTRDNRDARDNRDNRGDTRDNRGERKDFKKDFRDRSERPPRAGFAPRDRADRSFGSDKSDKTKGAFKPRGKFIQTKELTNPVSLDTPFPEPSIEPNAQHEVSVTWIISPDSFYTQILSEQAKFLQLMHKIPEMYKGVKPFAGEVSVGASVLARYPEDGVLYRANVVSAQPFGKFIVQYIDFGNKFLVDTRDIWQLDSELMELPRMAVHCTLVGVAPKDGEWKADSNVDLCFNAPRYQCIYQENVDGKYKVSLWNNGASVADMLIEKQLAMSADVGTDVTLKDEPIDLTIIVGQQILCKVTHVESFEKFYVQFDLDKAALVEAAIDNFDSSLLTPLSAESLQPDVHCTLRRGGRVHRAVIRAVGGGGASATRADLGDTLDVPAEDLMILPKELTMYYYQSLACALHNYTADCKQLVTLEQLRETLTDKKVIIYVNDVQEITPLTTLYDASTGKKIEIFEPDEGAYDTVAPLCARAVFNYNFGLAYVSHCESLNEIYLQKSTDGDRLAVMLDKLFKFYEEGTPEPLTEFDDAALCAAKSVDGNWYRAAVVSSTDTECTLQFPDYGNTETIAKESIKKLDAKFYEPCALGLVVSLGLVPLQDDALEKLKEWTSEKEVQVTLSFGADGWLASLHSDGVDLSMKLVSEKLATPKVDEPEVTVEAAEASEAVAPPPPGCVHAYISHIDSPGQFWLQMADKIDRIEEIQVALQTQASGYADLEDRELGTVCVARFTADDMWYRAEILDADADITTVRFIDYGNTDVLDNAPGGLKVMPDAFRDEERHVIRCSVNAVPTGTGQWSEPASEHFTQLVGDLASLDALVVLKGATTYVDLFIGGQNLTERLVAAGHATRADEPECGGDMPTCFASHVNSPSEFWIQLETAAPELQAMEGAMVDAEAFPELSGREEGVLCAAKYPEDGAWYRAQVIVDGSEGTEVLFMDYGNASMATELRSLPDELKAKPALSRKCALQKPRDVKAWSRRSEVKFNELAAEGATIFNVQFIASGDISIVELYFEGKSVTEELVGLCEEQPPPPERPDPVGQDLVCSGTVCHVNSASEFYVQLAPSAPDREKVMERLIDAESFAPLPEREVGSVCAALWAEDDQWYRAKIVELCDAGAHAQFIDYGNRAKCEDFRQLPAELAQMEPLAKCCRLAVDETAADAAKARLDKLIADVITFQIEILDSTKEPMLVKIAIEGEDIRNSLAGGAALTDVDVSVDVETNGLNSAEDTTAVEEKPEVKTESALSEVPQTLEVTNEPGEETVDFPTHDTPTVDAPADDTPKVDTLKEDAPTVDALTVDAPTVDAPTVDAPTVDALTVDEPIVEAPTVDAPTVDAPTVDALTVDAPTDDKPTVDALTVDAPTDDKPTIDAPVDLNESIDSAKTVIENRSFESAIESFDDTMNDDSPASRDGYKTPEQDYTAETLETSDATVKSPESNASKETVMQDAGYTSEDQDKSPKRAINSTEVES